MTIIKGTLETSYIFDREDYIVEDKKLSENKRRTVNQQGNTGSEKRTKIRAKRQVEKDEDGIVFETKTH